MKLNIHIIYDALKKYKPVLHTKKEKELIFTNIRLFKNGTNTDKRSIYMMEADQILKYHTCLQDIDLISIGFLPEEIKYTLSVIEINDRYDIIAVFNEVQDVFYKYETWNNNLMKSIASHESLQSIANKAASELDNPFVVFDIAFKIITTGGNIPKDYEGTSWESIINKEYIPLETFQFPDNDLYFFLKHNKEIYYPQGSPYNSNMNIFLNIYVEGQLFAILAESDVNVEFTNGQLSLIIHIRNMLEFGLTSYFKSKGTSEILTYYVEKLLKGLPVSEKILRHYLEERGWSISGYFCVYTLSNLNGEQLSDNQEEFCLLRIKKMVKSAIVFTYDHYIIVITKQMTKDIDTSFIEEMGQLLNKLELRCGYSHLFYHFSELQSYYNQSRLAILEGEIIDPEKVAWNFNDYYFQYIINVLSNSINLKTLCHPGILKLLNYDKENNTDYIKCVQTYLVNGCNLSQTGKDLFMHRNTLVYRLEKIQQMLEIDVEKLPERERMQLWFSCMLCEYM